MSAIVKPSYLDGCHLVIELFTPEGEFVKVLAEGRYPDHQGALFKYIFQCCEYKHKEPEMHVQARLYELKAPCRATRRLVTLSATRPYFMYLTFDDSPADCPRVCWTQSKKGELRRLGRKKGYVPPFQHS